MEVARKGDSCLGSEKRGIFLLVLHRSETAKICCEMKQNERKRRKMKKNYEKCSKMKQNEAK
jgi:hypothetical protein